MSTAQRAELRRAIENDEITNATAYAEEFARRHGLNPVTVRSAISRLRSELGMLKRPSRSSAAPTKKDGGEIRVNAVTLLKVADATDPRFARVAAAAFVRYEEDAAFRDAVDRQRPEIERISRSLSSLRETTSELLPEEQEDVLRLFAPD